MRICGPHVERFVAWLGEDLGRLTAAGIRSYILKEAGAFSASRAKAIVGAVRTLLRYLVIMGQCPPLLLDAVPTVAHWRLASLPRYVGREEVDRVVDSCDVRKLAGLRDRAILLLLARLALRAGDIAALRRNDIDWHAARIRVVGKTRREAWLPLPQDVGDSILKYLEKRHEVDDGGFVFLRLIAPHRPISSMVVSTAVGTAMKRAGIRSAIRGAAHVLRHSAATQMLRQGASLDEVGLVLRHSGTQSTTIYAKVDINALRTIAQPWPGEALPC
jgi:site-specific recombinase XerD